MEQLSGGLSSFFLSLFLFLSLLVTISFFLGLSVCPSLLCPTQASEVWVSCSQVLDAHITVVGTQDGGSEGKGGGWRERGRGRMLSPFWLLLLSLFSPPTLSAIFSSAANFLPQTFTAGMGYYWFACCCALLGGGLAGLVLDEGIGVFASTCISGMKKKCSVFVVLVTPRHRWISMNSQVFIWCGLDVMNNTSYTDAVVNTYNT